MHRSSASHLSSGWQRESGTRLPRSAIEARVTREASPTKSRDGWHSAPPRASPFGPSTSVAQLVGRRLSAAADSVAEVVTAGIIEAAVSGMN
jgi:hypothetical protein